MERLLQPDLAKTAGELVAMPQPLMENLIQRLPVLQFKRKHPSSGKLRICFVGAKQLE